MIRKTTGKLAENLACHFLEKQGLLIIQRNFYTRFSELDIVAFDKEVVVFVEVKFRKSSYHGSPLETVDYRKQQKLILAATEFLLKKGWYEIKSARFDVLAISQSIMQPNFEWIKHAFQPE